MVWLWVPALSYKACRNSPTRGVRNPAVYTCSGAGCQQRLGSKPAKLLLVIVVPPIYLYSSLARHFLFLFKKKNKKIKRRELAGLNDLRGEIGGTTTTTYITASLPP